MASSSQAQELAWIPQPKFNPRVTLKLLVVLVCKQSTETSI